MNYLSKDPTGWQTYRRLLSYTRSYIRYFLLGAFGFLLYAQTQWVWAELIEYLVKVIESGDYHLRGAIALAVVVVFMIRGVGSFLGNYGISYVARQIVHRLRVDLFKQMLRLPVSYYHSQNSGHLLARITFNIEQVASASSDAFKTLVQEGFTVLGLLVYLFYSNWKLSLLFVLIAPLIALVVHFATKRLYRLSRRIQESMGDVTHVASESISAYTLVKSFGGESYEAKRFAHASNQNMDQGLKLVVAQSINTPLVQLLVALAMAGIIWFALTPDIFGKLHAGSFLAYITAAGLLTKPIRQLTQINSALQRGIAGAKSVFEILDLAIEEDSGSYSTRCVRGDIAFNGVSFQYAKESKEVLQRVTLFVLAGQKIALVGRSGGGKSTLVNLLPRFYAPTEGHILLDGRDIASYRLDSLRRQIAWVSQKVSLFNDTLRHNIAYGELSEVTDDLLWQAIDTAALRTWIESLPLGLDTLVGEDGVQLSGGQRQRIAIARAVLKNAPILILDEATSALDNETEKQIQVALEALMQGRTTFIIAHRLSTIVSADLIVVMDQGQIVEQGTHTQLLRQQGLYASLQGQYEKGQYE